MAFYYLGIDLGGTKILTGLADEDGKILVRSRKATEAAKGQAAIIDNILATIEEVLIKAEIKAEQVNCIGVGSPGPLDVENGIIVENSNLPWKNVPIVKIIEEKTGIKTLLKNDANAAALGEKWFGAGKDVDNMFYVTVSTGVGGGAIINKKLFTGVTDNACEIGHTVIDPAGPLCGCGNHGCLESFTSGSSIARLGQKEAAAGRAAKLLELADGEVEAIDAVLIARSARLGDKKAKEIYQKVGYYLGIGLANTINLFNPEMIVLGGGVMRSADLFLDKAVKTMHELALATSSEIVEVKQAALAEDIGLMGAIAVAMEDRLIKNE